MKIAENSVARLGNTLDLIEGAMNQPDVNLDYMKLNSFTMSLEGVSSDFDPQTREFFGNIVFELWIYDEPTSSFAYHERYVDLKLNMTGT